MTYAPVESILIGGARRFAKCWKITRADATEFAFTNHGSVLNIDGIDFVPGGSISASAEAHDEGLSPSNRDVRGAIRSDMIKESDLRAGLYRGAVIDEFVVDWEYPFAGKFYQRSYVIEDVKFDGEVWNATIVSSRDRFNVTVGNTAQKTCNVEEFGDARCGVNKASYVVSGRSVSSVTTQRLVIVTNISTSFEDDYFTDGQITWTTGNNAGLKSDVKQWTASSQKVELYAPTPYTIQAGDTFSIVPDCDRTIETCDTRYGNAIRHRGFPDVPGTDRMLETPDPTE